MTTEQTMLTGTRPLATTWRSLLCGALAFVTTACAAFSTGCAAREELRSPYFLSAPYAHEDGELLWAVAPLRNESGTALVDTLAVSDTLAQTLHQVEGLNVVPVNRVIGAMRTIGLSSVDSPSDAVQLARSLGVDAIVVGSITAWDPYDPLEIGLSVGVYATGGAMRPERHQVDPRAMTGAGTDLGLPQSRDRPWLEPVSTASEHLHAANHAVQYAVRSFAEGRHDPNAAMGWRRYLASMRLFTEFACHRTVERLLDAERARLARADARLE